MFGEDVGNLTLKYQHGENDNENIIWRKSGTQGEKWRKGSVQIPNLEEPYNLIIDGTVGATEFGNIAIDDITVEFQACPIDEAQTCNFENDFCSFKNKRDIQWERVQAKEQETVLYDHTYFSPEGYVAVLLLRNNIDGHGVLEGGLHAGGKKACVHSYYLRNSPQQAFLKMCVKKLETDENVSCQELELTGNQHQWKYIALDVDTEGVFLETEEWMVI